jgi:putative transposase
MATRRLGHQSSTPAATSEASAPDTTLSLDRGAHVSLRGKHARITSVASASEVLVKIVSSGRIQKAHVSDLQQYDPGGVAARESGDLADIDPARYAQAEERLKQLRPLLVGRRTKALVEARAKELGVGRTTLYRWLREFADGSELTSSLMRKDRSDKGGSRLSPVLEAIVQACIDAVWMTKRKRTLRSVMKEVRRRCRLEKQKAPHPNTVAKRIAARSPSEVAEAREGKKVAEEKYAPMIGRLPGADWPMAIVQIDHVEADVEIVDDVHRLTIGRPWITVAIDVFSRMVVGIYVSLDPPNALAVGVCLGNAMLTKDAWLRKLDVPGEWPVWGHLDLVHADNAREFRGNMLKTACKEYGIDLRWRRSKTPRYGGYIERYCGTLGAELKSLPGTTKSSPKERGVYKSGEKAALTLFELEQRIVEFIVNDYHLRPHSGLGKKTCPLAKWNEGIVGTATRPGKGLPERFKDEMKLRLDWLPYFERTIQDTGVVFEYVHYYHDVLRPWIKSNDRAHRKEGRKFVFRYDPRDMGTLWFFDPEIKRYYQIPYRDISHPHASLWELRRARREAGVTKEVPDAERRIFEAHERMRVREEESVAKSKAARRNQARRRSGMQRVVRAKSPPAPSKIIPPPDLKPFDDD